VDRDIFTFKVPLVPTAASDEIGPGARAITAECSHCHGYHVDFESERRGRGDF
jgi:hypothetical protein